MNQPTDHSTNRPTNYRAANQPKVEQTYLTTFNTGDYDPPCLAYFIVMMMRRRRMMMMMKMMKIVMVMMMYLADLGPNPCTFPVYPPPSSAILVCCCCSTITLK